VVRQRAKGPVDPGVGARVRELRVARQMTQADLAGTDFTKGFISLLETGRTRVSLRAAEILARKLGISASELIAVGPTNAELDLTLLRAEQMLSSGRAADAIEVLQRISAEATGTLKARALRARGRALVESGRPRDGLVYLEEAGRAFVVMGERELQIRTTYDRALAYAHLNEPGTTLTLALECDAAMRAGGLIDRTLDLQLRSLLATAFARIGDFDSSDVQAQQALQLAEDVVDRDALATLYSTISLTRQRENRLDDAVGYARKSLALYEELGRERSVGQTWHNLASMYVERGEYDQATKALERADRIASGGKIAALQARVLTTRAELAVAQRRWAEADKYGRAGAEHPAASGYTRARGLLAQARALAADRSPLPQIRVLLDEAIKALQEEPPRVRAEIHEAYAAILGARGQWQDAYTQAQSALRLLRPNPKHHPAKRTARTRT
jgi:tetratricopeptide (TPR) repeat protein